MLWYVMVFCGILWYIRVYSAPISDLAWLEPASVSDASNMPCSDIGSYSAMYHRTLRDRGQKGLFRAFESISGL